MSVNRKLQALHGPLATIDPPTRGQARLSAVPFAASEIAKSVPSVARVAIAGSCYVS